MKRYIVTGAPGAGKTAIIRQLEIEGFSVVEEAATDVIALWQAKGIAEPWTRPEFIDAVVSLQQTRERRVVCATGLIQFHDRSVVCTARIALERRAFQRQITGLRLPDGDPADLRNIDAPAFELDPLRDSERLMGAVFFLEFGEARTLFKEVVKGLLAVGDGLLQQLRINFFQPLETRLVFKPGQLNRKLRPGDGFAG